MRKKRLVTGITPTGSLTIGNYFGILKHLNSYLDKGFELFVFVADVHALSVPQNITPFEIKKNTLELLTVLNSLGISNSRKDCNVFIQSQHYNLKMGFISQFFTSIGELERMTQFKTKKENVTTKNKTKQIPTGLLTYPTLMAADILLYKPNIVPVGLDQKQHLELTKTIASRFNKKMEQDYFIIPEFIAPTVGGKIKSLLDPEKKMSKSDTNKNSAIYLFDSLEDVENKLMKSKTDSHNKIMSSYRKDQLGVANLLDLYFLTNGEDKEKLEQFINEVNTSTPPYKYLKREVIKSINNEFINMRKNMELTLEGTVSLDVVKNKLENDINWKPKFMTGKDWDKKQTFIRKEATKTMDFLLSNLGFIS